MTERPESSCLVGSWLVKGTNPMQAVMSETLALAEDGYVRATAYEDGYVLSPGTRTRAELPPDRAALLDMILGTEGELRLRREPAPPGALRGTRISLARIQKGVTEAALERGYLARPYVEFLGTVIAVLVAALLMWRKETVTALLLCMGAALLGTWSLGKSRLSRAGAAEQRRLLALRDGLRRSSRPAHPRTAPASVYRLLPWAVLLLDGEDFGRWYADTFLHAELPSWWTQEPNGQDPTLRFVSQEGMKGLLHSLLHHVGP
ncbi:hypothetical protein [Streptomyces griseomycini]|uniref:Uncharacterized protein n=1 Tax=Streptomyces griseomycini TaxID=66895 RepID=A0A7W7PXX0_9ACTN|nr:hypothetical protein [Streptomyces griseomycini]MBB4903352.1 hypothetical protein [Streptomyces griseomycini]